MNASKKYASSKLYGYIVNKKMPGYKEHQLLYIGTSNDITNRHHSHCEQGRIAKEPINRWLQEHPDDYELITFEIIVKGAHWKQEYLPSPKLAKNLETAFIKTFAPQFNKNQKK